MTYRPLTDAEADFLADWVLDTATVDRMHPVLRAVCADAREDVRAVVKRDPGRYLQAAIVMGFCPRHSPKGTPDPALASQCDLHSRAAFSRASEEGTDAETSTGDAAGDGPLDHPAGVREGERVRPDRAEAERDGRGPAGPPALDGGAGEVGPRGGPGGNGGAGANCEEGRP